MHFKSITEIAGLISRRQVSVAELLDHHLDRIEALDAELGAFSYVDVEGSRRNAARLDAELAAGRWRGPLHGVPIAVKDIYGIEGQPFEIGMPSRKGARSEGTATAVQRLEEAGVIVVGRLHLTEGVYSEHIPPFTAPKNPWDTSRWAGASSSGSGVATAAGLVPATLGSDTGGSIRIPCSANGISGLKPTWGRVSRHGIFPFAATLDHPGPMARTVADTGLLLEVMAGHDAQDPTSSLEPVPNLSPAPASAVMGRRIGVDADWAYEGVTADAAKALDDAIAVFEELGATIVPMKFPDSEQAIEDWFKVCGVQAHEVHSAWLEESRDEYGPALRELLDLGRSVSGREYQELILRRIEYSGRVYQSLQQVDSMLIPGLPFEAPPAAEMLAMDEQKVSDVHRFTVPFTMSQTPTVTMPGGFAPGSGMPLSVQLVSGTFEEKSLVELGSAYQSVTEWHRRHPEVSA